MLCRAPEHPACGHVSHSSVQPLGDASVLSLQAGEKHYHPLCALCVRCGRMFAEGEEMYLQGEDTGVLLGPLGRDTTSGV